jgi:hypothetical protein
MFAIYACLRPALGTLEPPQRLRLNQWSMDLMART